VIGFLSLVAAQAPVLTGYDKFVNLTGSLVDNGAGTNTSVYYALYYTVIGNSIRIGIVCDGNPLAPTAIWCGFGISQTGLMVGDPPGNLLSDAVVGYVDPLTNQTFITDFATRGRNPPLVCGSLPAGSVCTDAFIGGNCSSQVTATSGYISNGYLVIQYTKPLPALDVCDVGIVLGVPTFVIHAIGTVQDGFEFPDNVIQHEYHGPRFFQLTFTGPTTTGVAPIATSGALTSGVVPITSGAISTGVDVTTGVASQITSGAAAAVTTGSASPPATTGDAQSESSSASQLALAVVSLIAFLF